MSAVARSLPDRLRQVWAATRLDLTRLSRGRYRRARQLLIGLPVLASGLVALILIKTSEPAFVEVLSDGNETQNPTQSLQFAVKFMWPLSLRFCMFLAAIDVFGGLFRGELAERTLHHLYLQPLRRETVTVGKYLAGLLTLGRMGAICWLLVLFCWLIPHGPAIAFSTLFSGLGLKILFSYILALLLAMAAYGGLFLLAGMLARGPMMVGAALWLWETLAIFLPLTLQRFTVSYWVNSLIPLQVLDKPMLAQEVAPASFPASVVVCLLIGAGCTAGAAWWSRHLQLAYGAKD
jgi:ABC-type transport system involved in multi-copper enzyme maturation permease subunit